MVGKRWAPAAVAAALLLTSGAAPAFADEALPASDTSLVEVFVPGGTDIDALASKYDVTEYKNVEDDGSIQIHIDSTPAERAALRAAGFRIGRTIEDASTRAAVAEERDAAKARLDLAAELAQKGLPKGGIKLEGKSVVPTPGETVIQRANTFTNYAGRFLYVEAYSKANTTNSGPTQALSYAGPDGVYSTATNMSKFNDGGQYMYHRQLIRLTGAAADIPANEMTVRVAATSGAVDTFPVTEWLGSGLPNHAEGYLTGFFNRYQDPTENRAQLDALAAEFPNLVTPVNLPNLTGGYQRKAQTIVGLATPYAGATGNNAVSSAAQGTAVVLTTLEWGHLGGNEVTAQIVNAGASKPLEVSVSGKAITIQAATDEAGAITSTAAQVVAAINASPAASALVFAQTYRGNAGAGIVNANATPLQADDYLNAPSSVERGPFQVRMYRVGAVRDGSKTGVFIYCQQHAREWTTGLTCVETAEQLVRNYALDPHVKELLDNVEVFILPNVNPDGAHYSMYDYASQRKNMTNHCPITGNSDPAGRNQWGVDLNRNSGEYSGFDGYVGGGSSCTGETFQGPAEYSEPEIKNEKWVADTFPNIKFAVNVHSYGGYFMWAPGAYKSAGRETAPAPNIGIEKYFFEAGDAILARIKEYRGTVILPQRTGPIADVLYSAAGNSADDQWYRKGIISYSFETGADKFTSTTSGTSQTATGFQPCFGAVGTGGGAGSCPTSGLMVNEGRDQAMEFAAGNFGLVESAYAYAKDTTPPSVSIEYSAAQTAGEPINFRFNWDNEASVIHYTTDGSTPTLSSPTYEAQRARGLGEVLTLSEPGAHTVKWIAVDIKGNVSEVKSQRLLVAADDEQGTVGGEVPATLSLSLGSAVSFGAFTPGVTRDYTSSTTATVVSTAGEATLSVADASATAAGHLVNGAFTLPAPLQASGDGETFAPISGAPLTLKSYMAPVSNDVPALSFKQTIGATDPLRTGTYSKTLTFTLSTTQP